MKFAVIATGGKQYLVTDGEMIKLEKLDATDGANVEFTTLLRVDGDHIELGQPELTKKISAEVVKSGKDDKITVIKYKPKVRYRRKRGHRQHHTVVKIATI